ncbi:MAG: hypothetical protein ABSB56_06635, partial [Nitrososphaerales archaeon]
FSNIASWDSLSCRSIPTYSTLLSMPPRVARFFINPRHRVMTWVGGAIYNDWPEPVNSTYFALYVTGVFNYSFDKPVTSSSTTYTTPLMLWIQDCRLTG